VACTYRSMSVEYGLSGRPWLTANWKATAVSSIVRMMVSLSANSSLPMNMCDHDVVTMMNIGSTIVTICGKPGGQIYNVIGTLGRWHA
jgi:hypothetical protein